MTIKVKHIFKKNTLTEIFTPSIPAALTYVKRDELEKNLLSSINMPGEQLLVCGLSGSGKTTLVTHVLNEQKIEYIIIDCNTIQTFDDLIMRIFDVLDPYFWAEYSTTDKQKISATHKADFQYISLQASTSYECSQGESYKRMLLPSLTSQKVAEMLSKSRKLLVLEDFHIMPLQEQKMIASLMKTFVNSADNFPHTKIICIGAVHSLQEIIQLEPDLHVRVAEIFVPLLTKKQIENLIKKGINLLNISMSKNLITQIAYYSNNLAAIAHHMCYSICENHNVIKSQIKSKEIKDSCLYPIVQTFVKKNMQTLQALAEINGQDHLAWSVLREITKSIQKEILYQDLKRTILTNNTDIEEKRLKKEIDRLIDLNILLYDPYTHKYSLSSNIWGAYIRMKDMKNNGIDKYQKKTSGYEYYKNTQQRRSCKKTRFTLINEESIDAIATKVLLDEEHKLEK